GPVLGPPPPSFPEPRLGRDFSRIPLNSRNEDGPLQNKFSFSNIQPLKKFSNPIHRQIQRQPQPATPTPDPSVQPGADTAKSTAQALSPNDYRIKAAAPKEAEKASKAYTEIEEAYKNRNKSISSASSLINGSIYDSIADDSHQEVENLIKVLDSLKALEGRSMPLDA